MLLAIEHYFREDLTGLPVDLEVILALVPVAVHHVIRDLDKQAQSSSTSSLVHAQESLYNKDRHNLPPDISGGIYLRSPVQLNAVILNGGLHASVICLFKLAGEASCGTDFVIKYRKFIKQTNNTFFFAIAIPIF